MDLVWYSVSAAAELRIEDIKNYKAGKSAGIDWAALYKAINTTYDDGYLAKFIRVLKNGEDISKPFEHREGADSFPIKGEI